MPHYRCPGEVTGPSHTRKTRYTRKRQLSQHKLVTACCLVLWVVGKPTKNCLCARCETKDNYYSPHRVLSQSQELNGVTFLCSDLQGVVFESTGICLLETKASVWALYVHTQTASEVPTAAICPLISLLHVRFLLDHLFCVHSPPPATPCLCRLHHSFCFGL